MNENTVSVNANTIALVALGVVGALLVLAVLSGKPIPLISRGRGDFVALLIIGIAMCALGPLRTIQPQEWAQPMNVVAIVLGTLALLLGVAVLTGIRVPLISNHRTAFVVLVIVILAKVVLAGLHHA